MAVAEHHLVYVESSTTVSERVANLLDNRQQKILECINAHFKETSQSMTVTSTKTIMKADIKKCYRKETALAVLWLREGLCPGI